uniref:Uncharacterized protein n=1 Tax=Glossina palpalis gambiensis TaxID=67801 RepID=A0A1B0AUE8_9MUSC
MAYWACTSSARCITKRSDFLNKTVVTVRLEWKQADTVLATTKCGQANNKIKESNDNEILYELRMLMCL